MTDVEMEFPEPKRPRPWEAVGMDPWEYSLLTEWERNQMEGTAAARWAEIGHSLRMLGYAILRTRPIIVPILLGTLAGLALLLLLGPSR